MLKKETQFAFPSSLPLQKIVNDFGFELIAAKNHRKIWQIETVSGYKYLKKSRLNQSDLFFIFEALEYLHRRLFTQAPRLLLSKQQEPFVAVETDLYIMTEWYWGHELDFEILMDLKQAARFLAEFHLKSQGFIPNAPQYRACWFDWPQKLAGRLEQLQDFRRIALTEKETSAFSRLFLRYFEPFYRQAISSYEALLQSPYLEVAQAESGKQTLCHHDYSGRNLLRTYGNDLLLVDFDYCLRDLRIHDLLNLLSRNLKHSAWNPEVSRFILHHYHQVSPLTPSEIIVMQILLSWPQDFWQLGLQYYYEKLPWPKERFLTKMEHKIKNRFAREKFLEQFPSTNGLWNWKPK